MKPDELDLLLAGASLAGLLLLSYGLGAKRGGLVLAGGALFTSTLIWGGVHGGCQPCRNRFAQWRRKLGRQLIE